VESLEIWVVDPFERKIEHQGLISDINKFSFDNNEEGASIYKLFRVQFKKQDTVSTWGICCGNFWSAYFPVKRQKRDCKLACVFPTAVI